MFSRLFLKKEQSFLNHSDSLLPIKDALDLNLSCNFQHYRLFLICYLSLLFTVYLFSLFELCKNLF